MNIDQALRERRFFGGCPWFKDLASWHRWRVFLKAVYGLPLTSDELQIFCKHTGRSTYSPPPGGWNDVAAIVGRQSGKTRIASLIQDFAATTHRRKFDDGTPVYALTISQDHRASLRTLFSYARAPFDQVPAMQQLVTSQTADTLTLSNGVTLASYPCRPQAVRGLRACVVVLDELAFFRSSENIPLDREMIRAVRPTLASTGGKLIIISSPGAQSGALYDLHRQHYGRDDSPTLVWQATAPEMNPTLSTGYLARMQQDDPEGYRAEVLGEFRAGTSTFLDPEAIAACVQVECREQAPQEGVAYYGFADPSGGRRDKFTAAVAHRQADFFVLDAVRAWSPPFNPSSVIAEAGIFLKSYFCRSVTGDRYSAEFVAEQFRTQGIEYRPSDADKSGIYLELLPLINSGKARLLDEPDLLRELRGLERKRATTGRDRVDHAQGAHDDVANSAAGALVLVAKSARYEIPAGLAEGLGATSSDFFRASSWRRRSF